MGFRRLLVVAASWLLLAGQASAQFKSEAFKQSYNDDTTPTDSVDKIFSIKEYFGGLSHTATPDVTTMFEGSLFAVGGMQIYNRDYWKLPVIYGGIAAGVTGGLIADKNGRSDLSPWFYAGAGAFYWGALMDGVVCYEPDDYPRPGKAALYALLCPGLGQIYNHEMWKLSIYWGGMLASGHYYFLYKRNFERYRSIYRNATSGEEYSGPVSAETAKYYKNLFRRYRDYSTLAFCAVYLLQAIDANVFAYMHEFEVVEDVSLDLSPTVIVPDNAYAFTTPAVGMSIGVRF